VDKIRKTRSGRLAKHGFGRDMSAHIRIAIRSDALCLGVLATQVFLDTYATSGIRAAIAAEVVASFSTQAMEACIGRHDGYIGVAEHAGHLLGFVQLAFGARHDLVASSAPAELERLYVQAPFTGQGIGAALLRHAEQAAATRGSADLWLTAWEHNRRALRFYVRHDYRDLGVTDIELQGERHRNRVLAKRLRG